MNQRIVCSILLSCIFTTFATAADLSIGTQPAPGAVQVVVGDKTADIYVDANDLKVVNIAANLLAEDVQRVTSRKPRVLNDANQLGSHAIIVGSIGKSALIDQLIASGKLDVNGVKGQWETYKIAIVQKPLPNVESAVVIAGSDRRGTAYGVFTVSESIGVSPWYWWADITPEHRDNLVISADGAITSKPPSVKYRGIFINDEDWGMQPWAAKTIEPETNDIGPKTYAHIFELLLRLKANFCWPAMHPSTKAFNLYPQNKVVADDYAIVMGSSHCEPMLRNNVTEWGEEKAASYNYVTNRQGVLDYWRQRVIENGKYENMYTLGMRGIHDSDMAGGGTRDERAARLNAIMADQRKMIADIISPKVSDIPQIFCPYKEVLLLYQAGAVPADDVTLVWADDNHGYIRQLATPEEQKRGGGFGVYYHISYWGRPHDYLWLSTIPPALVWEELSKAYDYNSRTLWVVNVGDLKPAEIGMNFAMQFAYDVSSYNAETIQNYLTDFAKEAFGQQHASEIAAILDEYYELNFQRKPEHMGFNTSQNPPSQPKRTAFSAMNNGDEIAQRLERFRTLRAKTDALYQTLPAEKKDAFYELVVYPVRGSASMNEMILNTDLNHLYAAQGRASAADAAERARAAHAEIQKETEYYNNQLAGGKWKNMMTSNPRRLPVFNVQELKTVTPSSTGSLGVAIEGSDAALTPRVDAALPLISAELKEKRFIDLFNRGTSPIEWSSKASAPWIKIDKTGGSLAKDERLWVTVDAVALNGAQTGFITITSGEAQYTINVAARPARSAGAQRLVEGAGYLSIPAEAYTQTVPAQGAQWKKIAGLGRLDDSVAVYPTTTPSITDPAAIKASAPRVEYNFEVYSDAPQATLTVQALPTHRSHPGRELRYAVAVDEEPLQIIDLESPEFSEIWSANVLRAAAFGTTKHTLKPGQHTLRIYMVDPGVVLDHLTIDLGGLKPSYLPPAATVRAN